MPLLKGNYEIEQATTPADQQEPGGGLLEQEYYRAALAKLGGSIAFIMKGKTFVWTGDQAPGTAAGNGKKDA